MNSNHWAEEAAVSIGEWILREAVEQGEGLSWYAWQAEREKTPRTFERRLVGGSLYGGTAGIALFLAELGRITGSGELLIAARLALLHSIRELRAAGDAAVGLYSGTSGWLFAAGTFLRHNQDSDLRELALEVAEELPAIPLPPKNFDLIGGAAGTIIGLLGVTDVLDGAGLESTCIRLGEHLLSSAHVEPMGLSWPSGPPRGANLCGLAHGAAGIGWALLELYVRTGRAFFKVGAEEAFAYERLWFDPAVGNWTDLRNNDLTQIQSDGRVEDLQEKLEKGEALPVYRKRFMAAWCHGGPGIGLTRARALEVLGFGRYREEIEAALGSFEISPHGTESNHSLCHGLVGNALARIRMAQALGLGKVVSDTQDHLRAQTHERVESGERWIPGGPVRDAPDPTLMVGEAGIGLGLLGLAHDVTSPVFPIPSHPGPPPTDTPDAGGLLESMALAAFPGTAGALGVEVVRAEAGALEVVSEGKTGAPTVPRLADRLQSRTAGDALARKGFECDLLALRRARNGFDRSLVFFRGTFPVEGEETATVAVAPWIEIARVNGDAWLLLPDEEGRWKARLTTLPLLALLDVLRTPMTRGGLETALCRSTGAEPEILRPWIRGQLTELVRAGIAISGPLAEALAQSDEEKARGDGKQ